MMEYEAVDLLKALHKDAAGNQNEPKEADKIIAEFLRSHGYISLANQYDELRQKWWSTGTRE